MRYVIKSKCAKNITRFYLNVAQKYKHTYSKELMKKNISDAYDSMFQIEKSLFRRTPTIKQWQKSGYHMAKANKWYYAYTINNKTITIEDACHEQNMHD